MSIIEVQDRENAAHAPPISPSNPTVNQVKVRIAQACLLGRSARSLCSSGFDGRAVPTAATLGVKIRGAIDSIATAISIVVNFYVRSVGSQDSVAPGHQRGRGKPDVARRARTLTVRTESQMSTSTNIDPAADPTRSCGHDDVWVHIPHAAARNPIRTARATRPTAFPAGVRGRTRNPSSCLARSARPEPPNDHCAQVAMNQMMCPRPWTATVMLITRRSRVQIPPPPRYLGKSLPLEKGHRGGSSVQVRYRCVAAS